MARNSKNGLGEIFVEDIKIRFLNKETAAKKSGEIYGRKWKKDVSGKIHTLRIAVNTVLIVFISKHLI